MKQGKQLPSRRILFSHSAPSFSRRKRRLNDCKKLADAISLAKYGDKSGLAAELQQANERVVELVDAAEVVYRWCGILTSPTGQELNRLRTAIDNWKGNRNE